MYYTEKIAPAQAAELLRTCGLSVPERVTYTAGLFREDGRLLATGSLCGDLIQGLAVAPEAQGEDLTAAVLTHLLDHAGRSSLYLFTKPERAAAFAGMGFRPVATAPPYAALLEWGAAGVAQYRDGLADIAARNGPGDGTAPVCAVVLNANPFTRGHRYLLETAARQAARVYALAVEEDVSLFPFTDRLAMLEQGTADLPNVTVVPGGRYVVSGLTFPSYFTGKAQHAEAHAAMDAALFAACVAPPLGVTVRMVGSEPLSPVTAVYNRVLQERLPSAGIRVIEVPRLETRGTVISATRVRALLHGLWKQGTLCWADAVRDLSDTLAPWVPETTLAWICRQEVWERLAARLEKEAREEERGQ